MIQPTVMIVPLFITCSSLLLGWQEVYSTLAFQQRVGIGLKHLNYKNSNIQSSLGALNDCSNNELPSSLRTNSKTRKFSSTSLSFTSFVHGRTNRKLSIQATSTDDTNDNINNKYQNHDRVKRHLTSKELEEKEQEGDGPGPILHNISNEFQKLFHLITLVTIPRERPNPETFKDGHDPFRYEWGTWINESLLEELMSYINLIKVKDSSVYNRLLNNSKYITPSKLPNKNENSSSSVSNDDDDNDDDNQKKNGTTGSNNNNEGIRIRIAGSDSWDCLLHVLPPSKEWMGRWPTGSWAIVKPLLGMTEISMLRGPDRNTGEYKKATKKQLRGGSDGTLGSGTSTTGDNCMKYVGGPLRCYTGLSGNTLLLEIIIRPPINTDIDMTGINSKEEIVNLDEPIESVLDIAQMLQPDDDDNSSSSSDSNNNDRNINPSPTTSNRKSATPIVTTAKEIKRSSSASSPGKNSSTTNVSPTDKENKKRKQSSLNSALFGGSDDDSAGRSSSSKSFDKVGGLDVQLESIARRVLASRANPKAARRLGVNHVRGILLSGPPGCGKTLLARELSNLLGAREPQIVNGPEILDKFIGEAEKKVRELFEPAELEYKQVGDDSALHVIILDEMDAIARKRGSASSDTTGVRDSVVNQLLAKIDGVREANNILVVGLTNRPELLDPALLRPGRLEVQLRVELPDIEGRRDILRIHTRQMRQAGGIHDNVIKWMEDIDSDYGLPSLLEHYTGAEIAGLVRSAASFALARAVVVASSSPDNDNEDDEGIVTMDDMKHALNEVRPALGKQDEILKQRFPYGISQCNTSMKRITRDLERFVSPTSSFSSSSSLVASSSSSTTTTTTTPTPPPLPPRLQSMLIVGAGGNGSGAGVTALGAWAAAEASANGTADYVRFITALDLLSGGGGTGGSKGSGGGGDQARAAALIEQFQEAREMTNSLLVLDDIDQLCAGDGKNGYSNVMLATLRALLRTPPPTSSTAKAGGQLDDIKRPTRKQSKRKRKSMHILATTSRSDAACVTLHELFDETIVVPLLNDAESISTLLQESLNMHIDTANDMSMVIMERLVNQQQQQQEGGGNSVGGVGCKTVLRLAERAISSGNLIDFGEDPTNNNDVSSYAHIVALAEILDDMAGDTYTTNNLCEVV